MILVHGYEQDKIPNTLATSQKTILLCLRTCSFTPCTYSMFYLSMRAMAFSIFGIYHTISELGKPLKNLWSSHCLLSKGYFQHFKSFSSIFSPVESKILCRYVVLSSLLDSGYTKIVDEQHPLVMNKTVLNNHTCYSLLQCTKCLSICHCVYN